jgi:ribonuclease VapC
LILDASAIVAILFNEPEHEEFLSKLDATETVGMGAPTLLESAIALDARLGARGRRQLDQLLTNGRIVLIAFEAIHWPVALEAWLRFGKGRHQARLNFCDCLTYATARVAGRPLLTKDPGFAKTDLELA